MQTYTHAEMGIVAGIRLFPASATAIICCAVGSILPDIAAAVMFAIDRMRGEQPLKEQTSRFLTVQEIVNSLILWGAVVSVTLLLGGKYSLLISASYFTHLVVDILTHGGAEYAKTDPSFLWPFQSKIMRRLAVCEYRIGPGILRPKFFEGAVIVGLIALLFS